SHVEPRVIGADYTIRYGGKLYQIQREQVGPRLRGQAVRVELHLDGRVVVRGGGGELRIQLCERPERIETPKPKTESKKRASGHGQHRWMHGFPLEGGPTLEQVIEEAYGTPHGEESQ